MRAFQNISYYAIVIETLKAKHRGEPKSTILKSRTQQRVTDYDMKYQNKYICLLLSVVVLWSKWNF